MTGDKQGESADRHLARLRAEQINWLKDCQILEPGQATDGAIRSYPDQGTVKPYFANFAALALLDDPPTAPLVRRYMDWYVRHLEDNGTIRDYQYDAGSGGRTSRPDSEDAYAGTFLYLAARYHQVCPGDTWVGENLPALKKVAGVITGLMDTDGLTFALANYRVKYLMDNCEAYRGLADFAGLLAELGDDHAACFRGRAARIKAGIEKVLWNPRRQVYQPSGAGLLRPRVNWRKFYPDATCQIFPALYGLISPASPRAFQLYRDFNRYQPQWTQIRPPDFPWVILAYWAARQGGCLRAREKLLFVQQAYVDAHAGSWFCAEAAFFVLTSSLLLQQGRDDPTGPVPVR
ncbi:MAG TPA: hypothetical protein VMW83_06050 [Spirochaetia bacterium]|nr:hypothetical protein [Spirochaetia bacterium]